MWEKLTQTHITHPGAAPRMAVRGSAAWVIAIVTVVALIVGSLLLTVADPVVQALFSSSMWQSTTSYGTDTLAWGKSLWTYLSLILLLGFLSMVWVHTRRAG